MKILSLLIKWVSNDTLLLYIDLFEYLEDSFFLNFARNSNYSENFVQTELLENSYNNKLSI